MRHDTQPRRTVVAGVDGASGGWIAVVTEGGGYADSVFERTFDGLLERLVDAVVVGVDIPICPPEDRVRESDVAARAFVGPRRSSVFICPPRRALAASTYADARAICPSLSAQAYALGQKILEVDRCRDDSRVFEVHPEVSFAALAQRHLLFSKKSWNGQNDRRALLTAVGIEVPSTIAAGKVAADDVLDAAVAAWTAGRIAAGSAVSLPGEPPLENGRPIAIWY